MIENRYSNGGGLLLNEKLFAPIAQGFRVWTRLDRVEGLSHAFELVENFLWLRLAISIGYITPEELATFIEWYEGTVVRAYAEISNERELPTRVNAAEWGALFGIEDSSFVLRTERFWDFGIYPDVPSSPKLEFQNLFLLSAELTRSHPTSTFLALLNFASDEQWNSVVEGNGHSLLSTQETVSSLVSILSLLREFEPGVYPPQRVVLVNFSTKEWHFLVNRIARDIQLWKLNFYDDTIAKRFWQAIRFMRRELADIGVPPRSIIDALADFDRQVDSDIRSWMSYSLEKVLTKADLDRHSAKSIDEIDISIDAYKALKRNNIEIIADLLRIDGESWRSERRFDSKVQAEIDKVLADMGLGLDTRDSTAWTTPVTGRAVDAQEVHGADVKTPSTEETEEK